MGSVGVNQSDFNPQTPEGPSGPRPNRFDTPTIEWLIEEMERYAPKEGQGRTIERINPDTLNPSDSPGNCLTSQRTPGAKPTPGREDIDDDQEYGEHYTP